ncbi:hypothetical protein [Erythrobacter crassostreae]|uniref:Heme oxygenase n=1 Tax=Erythrobacter crassostreae TaxID=2828328 RepID=A0A9X1F2T6_9SPHN|nr:hypothetical protein [Erythrobacter crassostrea]MBV7259022.1 hypothetical protein [Erythrobacter crassostrea]
MSANAPAAFCAPAQSHLIARDLENLAVRLPVAGPASDFAIGPVSDSSAIGAAWVLAGSSLGNRSILKELEKAGHADWPCAFLSDPGMLAFWKQLRPLIDEPADLDMLTAASEAAIAVFDHFIAHTAKVPDPTPSHSAVAA